MTKVGHAIGALVDKAKKKVHKIEHVIGSKIKHTSHSVSHVVGTVYNDVKDSVQRAGDIIESVPKQAGKTARSLGESAERASVGISSNLQAPLAIALGGGLIYFLSQR